MQIDWFTLVAQIVNFVILLYLLQRFLYGPIVKVMDQREQKIAYRLQEAERKREEADQEAQQYRQQRLELEEARDERLEAVREEVENRRKELLKEAQQEVQEKKRSWQAALQKEQDSFLKGLRQRVGQQALELARRALQDLAEADVERRMAEKFVTRLRDLESGVREEITESIKESDSGIVIRSAFELSEELQNMISDTIQKQFLDGKEPDARFESAPDLIAGIEMQVNGHRVAWTIQDYLAGLEDQVRQAIQQEIGEQHEVQV
jgi:F-type H+-transporting ATPase subunit b